MNSKRFFWLFIVFITAIGCVFFTMALTACFSDWQDNTGTITINLGSGSARSGSARSSTSWQLEDSDLEHIVYTITLTGDGGALPVITASGGAVIRETVPVGFYTVKAKAYYDDEPYASGTNTVLVIAGQNNTVIVRMYQVPSDDCDECGECEVCNPDTGCGECGECAVCNPETGCGECGECAVCNQPCEHHTQ